MKIFPNYTVSNSFVNAIADKGKVWWANGGKRVYIVAAVCWMAVTLAVFLLYRYLNRVNNHIDKDKNEVQVIPSSDSLPNSAKTNIDNIKKAIPNLRLEPSFDNHQVEKEITPAPIQTEELAINFVDERPAATDLPALSVEEQKIKAQIEAMNTDGNFNTIGIKTFPNVLDFVQANGTKLTRLDLTGFPDISDDEVEQLIRCCTSLSTLIINSGKINGNCLLAEAEKLQGLTNLDIRGCDQITDEGLKAIAEKLEGVNNLNITGCNKITDKGLEDIAKKLKELTNLNISYCYRITDEGLKTIAEKLQGLTNLDIRSCNQITDKGLKAIAEKLQGLTYLNIRHCYQITDKGLETIAETLKGLTYLDISYSHQITDKGLEAIAEKLLSLRNLDISWCKQITDKGLEAIADKLLGLTITR